MGSFDSLPSLVTELRGLRSRISDVERQRLGVSRKTLMEHFQGPADDGTFGGAARTMATVSIDPEGFPLIGFVSIGMSSQPSAAGGTSWIQAATQLVVGGVVVVERRLNLQANADIQHVSFSQGIPVTGNGEVDISIVCYVALRADPGQPDAIVGNAVLDVLRVGML